MILGIAESRGAWPKQLSRVQLPLLEKPLGGFRVIGLFSGLYRIWGKARRPILKVWGAKNTRSYLAASSGRSVVDTVWRQAIKAEATKAKPDHEAAALLWDLVKYYESLEHHRLAA